MVAGVTQEQPFSQQLPEAARHLMCMQGQADHISTSSLICYLREQNATAQKAASAVLNMTTRH